MDEHEARLKRLRMRSWRRGTREMDLVLGRFADAEIDRLSDDELTVYEALIDAPDREIFSWITGTEATPAEYDTPVFRRIRDFYALPESDAR